MVVVIVEQVLKVAFKTPDTIVHGRGAEQFSWIVSVLLFGMR